MMAKTLEYVSTSAAAALLGVTRGTLLKAVARGSVPVLRLSPRCFRFDLEALREAGLRGH